MNSISHFTLNGFPFGALRQFAAEKVGSKTGKSRPARNGRKNKTERNQVKKAEMVEQNARRHQQRARHQRRAGQFPVPRKFNSRLAKNPRIQTGKKYTVASVHQTNNRPAITAAAAKNKISTSHAPQSGRVPRG